MPTLGVLDGNMLSVVVVGAGNRGQTYTRWIAAHPEVARVVGVAEPHPQRRAELCALIEGEIATYSTWEELVAAGRQADAALVCTQDRDHTASAVALLGQGYHVLLEKPMAPTWAECEQIGAAAEASGTVLGICHVLRYTPLTKRLRELLAADVIGSVQSIQHLEPVGWYHYAHSFVRGNWRLEAESAPMLLAKSCHDIDWLGYVLDRPVERVASFGSLREFRPENAPAGSTQRCLDCPLERTCAYSATRIYLDRARAGQVGWPVSIITQDTSLEGVERALRETMYGTCVWRGEHDVVDRQVVALEYAGGITATFQMMPFTDMGHRRTQIFGTYGELTTDGETIEVFDFRTQQRTRYDVVISGSADAGGGHGGGDAGLMEAFCAACAGDRAALSSGPAATLTSHRVVFAIEEARKSGTVVTV